MQSSKSLLKVILFSITSFIFILSGCISTSTKPAKYACSCIGYCKNDPFHNPYIDNKFGDIPSLVEERCKKSISNYCGSEGNIENYSCTPMKVDDWKRSQGLR